MSLTRNISFAYVLALASSAPAAAYAQRINTITSAAKATVTIDGVVRDGSQRALAAAEVMVDAEHRAITNSRGEFSIPNLPPGIVEFTARRIGYSPVTTAIQADPGVTVHLAIKLIPLSTQLGTIVVEGKRLDKTLWQTGFYQRQLTGRGTYFDDAYLRHFGGGLGTLLLNVPSVNVDRTSNGTAVALGTLPNGMICSLNIFVDGNAIPYATSMGLDDIVNRDDVLAVEVYPRASEMPARISGLGGSTGLGTIGTVNLQGASMQSNSSTSDCGAVLIWTKPLEMKSKR
jgi:hypothetical protein